MFQSNVSLLPYNTFSLEAKARYFYAFKDINRLQNALKQRDGETLLILGGGSNILLTQDFEGLVLKNDLKGIEVERETSEHFLVKVQAGENWHQFVLEAIKHNWAGIENLSLIPGTVGAAPMQNIGAYGVEIEQVFEEFPTARTFPQIIIGGHKVGGYEQMVSYIEDTNYNGTGHG